MSDIPEFRRLSLCEYDLFFEYLFTYAMYDQIMVIFLVTYRHTISGPSPASLSAGVPQRLNVKIMVPQRLKF